MILDVIAFVFKQFSMPEIDVPDWNGQDENIEPKRNRRVIGIGSQILRAIGLNKIMVLGTPTKYSGLSGFNIVPSLLHDVITRVLFNKLIPSIGPTIAHDKVAIKHSRSGFNSGPTVCPPICLFVLL